MRLKLLILIGGISLTLLISLFSCDTCGPFPNKFKIVGLDWANYEAIYSDTAQMRLGLAEIVNDTVDFEKYSIHIKPKQETFFAQNCNRSGFSLIPSAYACDPALPHTDETIDSIAIIAAKDFDTTHPAGSDLSDLFDVIVLDYTNNIYYEKYALSEYVQTTPFVPNEIVLILTEQPDITTDFELLVQYYQEGIDYDYFEFLTDKIVLKRV